MQQALEALEGNCTNPASDPEQSEKEDAAITALRQALEEKQEPVAWYDSISGETDFTFYKPHRKPSSPSAEWIPLYTAPPKREWVGLTEAAIRGMCERVPNYDISTHDLIQFAHAIEAKLKERNA